MSGSVHILDENKLLIKDFSYDGKGPDAYFYVGTADSNRPNADDGTLVPYPEGSSAPLGAYNKKNITLVLPDEMETKELRWLSVWCKEFSVNFGELIFPHLMYTDDSDNNSNNDDYNNPETHEDSFSDNPNRSSTLISKPSNLLSFLLISTIYKIL